MELHFELVVCVYVVCVRVSIVCVHMLACICVVVY